MPRLFDVDDNVRIRITSKVVRWVDRGQDMHDAENVTWEGLTTGCYDTMRGERRRLIICHTIPKWAGEGTYQSNCDCIVLE